MVLVGGEAGHWADWRDGALAFLEERITRFLGSGALGRLLSLLRWLGRDVQVVGEAHALVVGLSVLTLNKVVGAPAV